MKFEIKQLAKVLASICFILAFIAFLVLFRDILSSTYNVSILDRFLISCGVAVLLLVGGILFYYSQERHRRNRRVLNYTIFVIFAFYLFQLILLLFFDQRYRDINNTMSIWEFYQAHHNLRPFATISEYWNMYQSDPAYLKSFITNIIGNLVAFVPFGLFVPFLFWSTRKLTNFVIVLLLSLFLVESMQIVLQVGSFDIDDILLNFSGGLAAYLVFALVLRIRRYVQQKHISKSEVEISDSLVAERWQMYLQAHNLTDIRLNYLSIDGLEEKALRQKQKTLFSYPAAVFAENNSFPQVGDYTLIASGKKAHLIVRTTEVRQLPYNLVSEELIHADGYDIKTEWQTAFKERFRTVSKQQWSEDSVVVFEFFTVIIDFDEETEDETE